MIERVLTDFVPSEPVRVRLIGGPTAVIEVGGLRILTDPTFDAPGEYPSGPRVLAKTVGPAATPEELGPVDVVLLSHDQHPDNLDHAGRALLPTVPLVVSTTAAAERLGPRRSVSNRGITSTSTGPMAPGCASQPSRRSTGPTARTRPPAP